MPEFITREEAIDIIKKKSKKLINIGEHEVDVVDFTASLVNEIKDIQKADAEHIVHDYWKGDEEDNDDKYAICSVCGESYDCGDVDITLFAKFFSYCPVCGAKMDGGD